MCVRSTAIHAAVLAPHDVTIRPFSKIKQTKKKKQTKKTKEVKDEGNDNDNPAAATAGHATTPQFSLDLPYDLDPERTFLLL